MKPSEAEPAKTPPPAASPQQFEDALTVIRGRKIPEVVDILQACGDPEFKFLERSVVYRWLNPIKPYRSDTIKRILKAAACIQQSGRKARFAGIENATEHFLLRLLEKIPELAGTSEVKACRSTAECLAALTSKEDPVDAALAPRHAFTESPQTMRLCKVLELPVSGIFGRARDDSADLAGVLKRANQRNRSIDMSMGILPNADYQTVMESFLSSYGLFLGHREIVTDSEDAFQRFKHGRIQGVIGHKVFIDNCYRKIEVARKKAKGDVLARLKNLHKAPNGCFRPVKMDLYVNVDTMSPANLVRILRLLQKGIAYITKNAEEKDFQELVGKLVGLSERSGAAGRKILDESTFEIKTFETATLLAILSRSG